MSPSDLIPQPEQFSPEALAVMTAAVAAAKDSLGAPVPATPPPMFDTGAIPGSKPAPAAHHVLIADAQARVGDLVSYVETALGDLLNHARGELAAVSHGLALVPEAVAAEVEKGLAAIRARL